MIELTKLNGKPFSLNALYIEAVQELPDTTVTLTTGSKFFVKESEEEVRERIISFYRDVQLLSNPYLKGEEDEK